MNGQLDDTILVRAAQTGDVDAFEELVRRHQTSVYRVALRILGSSADAQDAVQETFIRAWRALHRIAARRTTETLDEVEPEGGPDPADSAERRERLRAVTHAIANLPPEQRAALVLREFEGLSYQEVADILGAGLPAIKTRIHRARLTVIQQTSAWQ